MTSTRDTYSRVTDILYHFSQLDKIDPEVLRKAAERGEMVHRLCGAIIEGFSLPEVDESLKGYMQSFNQWWNEDFEILSHEERFYDDELKITGQVDLVIKHQDKISLVDIKTSSSPQKSWPLQLSAYKHLIKGKYKIDEIHILHLKKTGGEPKVHTYEDHYPIFLNCYETYKYFYANQKEKIDIELL